MSVYRAATFVVVLVTSLALAGATVGGSLAEGGRGLDAGSVGSGNLA